VIAALFVATGGVYFGLPNVDPWDEPRDARRYAGPHPVVAHPPCGAWGVFARQGWTHRELGDDDGCFASALASVRRWGGALEHPADSSAWRAHGLLPPTRGHVGWRVADWLGGWTCYVEQGNYGHRARKPTWLYAHGVDLPSLKWGASAATKNYNNQSTRERRATPAPFRDLLISIAESAHARRAA
jgi:hypothetical protein